MDTVIRVERLIKSFGGKQALHELELDVCAGEMVALIGPSGSGKSTLLRHLSGLACADQGGDSHVAMLGRSVQSNGRLDRQVRRVRAEIGYIFQQFNLIGRVSVLGNVLMGRLGRIPRWRGTLGRFSVHDKALAMASLERVGMADYAWQRASTLSGGQQQRVAIARALTQQAEVILADEPIASLDPESARKVMDILRDINETDGKTVVVTLHQVDYATRYCERVVALRNGRIHFDGSVNALSHSFLNQLYGSDTSASLLTPARSTGSERHGLTLAAA
ncbi:phosphonate ABC transporter ATP-binding protein [Allopusillimonas ginsengisoli]|uniref:phosphonate ABC transporter ATP-binding protein n=1 Tax=Allopusillimonas ginsengisoli TaxID=453575 RepID=UPI0010211AD7|nr:phosphonate ABC transporter ATP-binding protein [Allopusillimonas ginsengisoli]TEA77281.1 phosphonate ABC transporter ATP-binding protein [Allopusillimonas ginsengisoli]